MFWVELATRRGKHSGHATNLEEASPFSILRCIFCRCYHLPKVSSSFDWLEDLLA